VRYSAPALLVLAVLAAVLGACGSGSSPEEEVREAAIRTAATDNAKTFCHTMVTEGFLDEVFDGDIAGCVNSSVIDEEPGKPIISTVALRGEDESRALVGLRIEGGEADGLTGHVDFAKEGEEWKLDRFGDDYLLSVYEVSMDRVDEGAVSTPSVRACMGKRLAGLDSGALRNLTFVGLTDKAKAEKRLIAIAKECPGPLADYVAGEMLKAFAEAGGHSPAFMRCVRQELPAFIELTGIAGNLIVAEPDFASLAALEGLLVGVQRNCSGK